ncbi:hypothetical protein MKEN_01462800 [Mycena kentingensis (nom. inval.)]|nr:hypothetical protein MKEN_01462800 [Mycena kentingensis (nom. inval.)]
MSRPNKRKADPPAGAPPARRGRPMGAARFSTRLDSDDEMEDVPGRVDPGPRASSSRSTSLPPPPAPKPPATAPRSQTRPPSQGSSALLEPGLQLLPRIRDILLTTLNHGDGIGFPCGCGSGPATVRCRECWDDTVVCAACIVSRHRSLPFHRVERWTGEYFRPVQLRELGLRLNLCRNLDPHTRLCPHSSQEARDLTIVAENGVHTVCMRFCRCPPLRGPAKEEWEQLLQYRLFPSSWKSVRTAFTFGALRQFHVLSLTSKITAHDYIRSLAKLTNAVFPQDVQDRVREFQRAFRYWRYLATERRSGQAHNIDVYVPHRLAGSLAVRCPACPEVGYNITKQEVDAVPHDKRHKVTRFVSGDGNFKLQRMSKTRQDLWDFCFNNGRGTCVRASEFADYIKHVKLPDTYVSEGQCTHLRADRLQNMIKFRGRDVSGVVACQCARHGFFLPGGMVDLKRGEAFAYTDFALLKSLAEFRDLPYIVVTYDIWCQYHINLESRSSTLFAKMLPIIRRIVGAIPKMHIHNHKNTCDLLWNLNWLECVGLTVGELIETAWAELNIIAASTRQMNPGNRHDTLDDACAAYNWDKLVRIVETLVRLKRVAVSEKRRREADFAAVVDGVRDKSLIVKWEAMSTAPTVGKDGNVTSVFQANLGPGKSLTYLCLDMLLIHAQVSLHDKPHTPKSVRRSAASKKKNTNVLRAKGYRRARAGPIPNLSCLDWRMKLDSETSLRRRLVRTKADATTIRIQRDQLADGIRDYRDLMAYRTPGLDRILDELDLTRPEQARLYLPSDLTEQQRQHFDLLGLAGMEYELRIACAYEKLFLTRDAVRRYNVCLNDIRTNVQGQNAQTRAQRRIRSFSNDIQMEATAYMVHFDALVRLGLHPTDHSDLKILQRTDLYGNDAKPRTIGLLKEKESWIWRAGRRAGSQLEDEEAWQTELDRVKYHQKRELRNRCSEEVEILDEELDRASRFFDHSATIWSKLAEVSGADGGRRAYAVKQADMYMALASRVAEELADLPRKLKADEDKEEKATAKAAEEARRKLTDRLERRGTAEEDEDLWELDARVAPDAWNSIKCIVVLVLVVKCKTAAS